MRGRTNLGRSPSNVGAFGKFIVERYLAFGTSFKRILRMNYSSLDSRQKWDYVGNDEKVII